MSFWNEVNRKARKQHRCDWCSVLILKNTRYNYQSGMTGGEFSSLKFHLDCKCELDHTTEKECIGEFEDIEEVYEIFKDQYAKQYYKLNADCECSSGGRG